MKKIIAFAFALATLHPVAAAAGPSDTVNVVVKGVQRGAIVEGKVDFVVEASSAAGIKRLDVFVGDATVRAVEPDGLKQKVEAGHEWVTPVMEGGTDLAPNGEYAIRARAVAHGGAAKETIVKVVVDNPAAAPTGLVAEPHDDRVVLSWDPNPEPDILGYELQRGDGTSFTTLVQTSDTFFEDVVEPGTYSYRVVAVRNSAARSTGRPSLPGEPIEATVAAVAAGSGKTTGDGPGAPGSRASRAIGLEDASVAPRGLPGGATLLGSVGQTGLPELPDTATEWGTFDKELPYEIPEGGIPLSAEGPAESGARWRSLPPDALRWVLSGLVLIALAGGLLFAAKRIRVAEAGADLKL